MKNSKRLLSALLALLMIVSLAACASPQEETQPTQETTSGTLSETEPAVKTDVNILALKGPTGIGVTKLMQENDNGEASCNYNFTIAASPDEIVGKISSGEVDVAAAPINLAATLYKKTNGNVQLLAINTLGVLYILTDGVEINTIADLKGKTIYATGQGSTPEYILNFILSSNGLDPENDVDIQYLSEHAALAAKVAAGEVEIAMLPEPNVTSALSQNSNAKIALNLTEEWEKACDLQGIDSGMLVQGCLIVRKDWEGNTPEVLASILEDCKRSADFIANNLEDAATLCEQYEIIPKAAIAKKAIPNCNIVFLTGEEMKAAAQQNLQVLFDADPKSIGGAMPDDAFYYVEK